MTRSSRYLTIAAAGVLGLSMAACSSGPKMQAGAGPAVATAAGEVEAIAHLLDQGELEDARKRLDAALRADPMNPSLMVLHQGVVGDARADLGPQSFAYTVAAGDTIGDLAQRFLGNRLKSYQLARYNDIANPASLAPGQVIQIPGQPARAESGAAARAAGSAVAAPTRQPRPAPSRAAAPTPVTDTAGARRARTAGLAALNKGDVADAVALLQRAVALDPGNDAIARDLARARRIAATVRSQR